MAETWRDRVRILMEQQGINATQLSHAIGKGQTFIRDILDGRPGSPPSEPSTESFAAMAHVLGTTMHELHSGESSQVQRVTIIGVVADNETWAPPPNNNKKTARGLVIDFKIEGGEPVALEVRGKGLLHAGYHDGDLLIGPKRAGAHADNLLGLECIIQTERGERYLRYLERGNIRGTFNLRAHLPGEPPVLNQRLAWAAPVVWIRRRQH